MTDATAIPPDLFDGRAAFDPAADFDAFLRQVPARWAVYLLADADDRPVQLLCVKNLRYSLKRRLGTDEDLGPSKRVNYRDLVRRIHWRRVDSACAALSSIRPISSAMSLPEAASVRNSSSLESSSATGFSKSR